MVAPEPAQPARGRKRKASGGDPDRVKRPMNCFFQYCVALNEELRKTNLGLTFVGTFKEFSVLWNNLPPAERLIYKQRADEEAAEHKRLHPSPSKHQHQQQHGGHNQPGRSGASFPKTSRPYFCIAVNSSNSSLTSQK
ncbi:hypothetical protein F5Y08DRAFT_344142 [Xylaria arbuscula]|nr:hypothetical protein F5Y08DRAFT_344142 [Xylaria arbuscula]